MFCLLTGVLREPEPAVFLKGDCLLPDGDHDVDLSDEPDLDRFCERWRSLADPGPFESCTGDGSRHLWDRSMFVGWGK